MNRTSFNTLTLLVLKDHRLEKGISSTQMAEMLGFTPSQWSKIESGKSTLSMECFLAVARILNLSPARVLVSVERHAALFIPLQDWEIKTQRLCFTEDQLFILSQRYYESPGFKRRFEDFSRFNGCGLSVLNSPVPQPNGQFLIADVFRYALDAEFKAAQDTLEVQAN